ncbi:hypothetical protein D9V32_03215 [Mycetocola tolaasinivorans]|uniref:Uncharacterized protein n=1 Tax=Mycetocola tolaasinivorans TaxID=76635 RepID=A0A3L7ACD6_9MICO|nr:hypothetical protein [Mycetocola tolaasinivorans]RLP77470.1 hypothetical protein D9V32_03215 [Mycetocola tolaasinivorans]
MNGRITARAALSPRTLLVFGMLLALITVALMAPRCTSAAQVLRAPVAAVALPTAQEPATVAVVATDAQPAGAHTEAPSAESTPFCAPTGPNTESVHGARTIDQHTAFSGEYVTTIALGLEPIVFAVSPTCSHSPAAPLPQDLGISRT